MPSDRGGTPGADAGRRIGRYELIERIGRGGMGEVFLARDTQLGRTVAIKALAADHVPAHSDRERFRQEVANLVAVTHPYVAAVYDVVEDGDDLYIVMEHVRGRSLKDAAEADRRPRTIARWGQQVAEALAGIHAAGIVHRDLKPSNVMISESSYVEVRDSEIAKRFTSRPDQESATVEDLTRRGVAVGAPNYMSPERLRLERLGPRSDLFSLCILLNESLTGVHPFRWATPVDIHAAIRAGGTGGGSDRPRGMAGPRVGSPTPRGAWGSSRASPEPPPAHPRRPSRGRRQTVENAPRSPPALDALRAPTSPTGPTAPHRRKENNRDKVTPSRAEDPRGNPREKPGSIDRESRQEETP